MEWRLDDPSHHLAAREMLPKLRAALDGTLEVPPQSDRCEAVLALTLYYDDKARPEILQDLEGILQTADYVNEGIPGWAEVATAFLRLRKRGWVAEDGNRWGLTREGRRTIEKVVSSTMVVEALEQVNSWLAGNARP